MKNTKVIVIVMHGRKTIMTELRNVTEYNDSIDTAFNSPRACVEPVLGIQNVVRTITIVQNCKMHMDYKSALKSAKAKEKRKRL